VEESLISFLGSSTIGWKKPSGNLEMYGKTVGTIKVLMLLTGFQPEEQYKNFKVHLQQFCFVFAERKEE
jgi:hypothetical protein